MTDDSNRGPAAAPKEDLLRLLVDRVQDYAIFGLDPQGYVISWNVGAERIKGYRASEIIGKHFSTFYPEEALRTGWPQTELAIATRDGRFEDDGWRVRKDGSRFWANVVITALRDDKGNLRGFAKVTRDLSDRKRMERIEADARQISEFVAMLAHELRNPLGPIRNAVDVALQSTDPQRSRWALEVIGRQANHLTRLVDDLLDIGRITRGQIRLERRRVLLKDVVERALEATYPECEKRSHHVTVEYRDDALVRGDAVRLTQVVTNLLSNACKYTPDGGRIEVFVGRDDKYGTVTIRDTGVGITPELLPRLFDIFTQEERSLARSEGGLGIGLAVAQRLVEMHGGTLTATSPGPGCGSVFVVRIPLLFPEQPHGPETAELVRAAERGGSCVLVVDDNRDAAHMLAALLEAHGHATALAFDGPSAITAATRVQPDVALLDIGLPGMDGYQVARALRNEPLLRGIVLVAVTGYGSKDDRERALEAGFDAHVSKPVDYATLQRLVPQLGNTDAPRP